ERADIHSDSGFAHDRARPRSEDSPINRRFAQLVRLGKTAERMMTLRFGRPKFRRRMLDKSEIWKYLPFLRTTCTASGFSRSGGGCGEQRETKWRLSYWEHTIPRND